MQKVDNYSARKSDQGFKVEMEVYKTSKAHVYVTNFAKKRFIAVLLPDHKFLNIKILNCCHRKASKNGLFSLKITLLKTKHCVVLLCLVES